MKACSEKVVPEEISLNEKITPRWRLPKVMAVTGLARSTIWAWAKEGRFPAPQKLSLRVTAWRAQDIMDWLADPQNYSVNRGQ